ncbi:MAG: hypothetical protein M3Q97_08970 [Bacteroidota bacterium]|nr:hypothetical protein [Bacteroidota bacterium]
MKHFFYTTFLLFLSLNVFSQRFHWALPIGNGYLETVQGLASDREGNVYSAISYYDEITVGTYTVPPDSGFIIIKQDKNGRVIYAKGMASQTVGAGAIDVDDNGNIFIAGGFVIGSIAGKTLQKTDGAGSSGGNLFIACFDSSLNLVFLQEIRSKLRITLHDMKVDAAGNVYVCGEFIDSISFSGIESRESGLPYWPEMFIAKYHKNGALDYVITSEVQSNRTAGALAWSVDADTLGNVYAAGTFYQGAVKIGSTTLVSDNFSEDGSGGQDLFLLKADSGGNIEWIKHGKGFAASFGPDSDLQIAVTPGGDCYLHAAISSKYIDTTAFMGDTVGYTAGLHIYKLSTGGDLLWSLNGGGFSVDEYLGDIAVDEFGNSYHIGTYISSANDMPIF